MSVNVCLFQRLRVNVFVCICVWMNGGAAMKEKYLLIISKRVSGFAFMRLKIVKCDGFEMTETKSKQ